MPFHAGTIDVDCNLMGQTAHEPLYIVLGQRKIHVLGYSNGIVIGSENLHDGNPVAEERNTDICFPKYDFWSSDYQNTFIR